MKKILGIASSGRKNGNSEILLDKALEGAKSVGAKTEKIRLCDLNIKPCNSEGRCFRSSDCFIKDDMHFVYEKLLKADAFIIASPVYFGSITAQLKALIDRCQPIWAKGRRKKSKKGIFICVSGHDNKKFFRNSSEIIKIFLAVLGAKMASRIYVPGLEKTRDILKRKDVIKKTFLCGKRLAT